MSNLSILIPSRNEMFLAKTIENILENIEGDTEVIAVLDGSWANPSIPDNDRVRLIYNSKSIGQRASTNQAARLSKSKYLMKCDAHCAFDKGFDVKMMKEMQDDWTMVPIMKNLHAFDWVCPNGHRRYQGPSGPCTECGKETTRDIIWQGKPSPNSVSYCFDSTPHFQYFGEFAKRPEGKAEISDTMSLQGSCWMLTRKKYWELNVCDESFGSWGSQGIEVAAKTWLSGGRVVCNKKTWYAHMFRTQGGDFGFPYEISGNDQEKAKAFAKDLFFNNKWEKQIHPLSWLVEKFWPVKGWTEEDLRRLKENTFSFSAKFIDRPAESEPTDETQSGGIIYLAPQPAKGIIFYTDNQLKVKIAHRVQAQLKKISKELNIPIVSSSLKPMPHFGDKNVHFPSLKRGYHAMYKQILGALENSDSEVIFFAEHDVIYHPSHFDFTPPRKDYFYYNQNWWRIRLPDGYAVHWDANQVSGLCAYKELLLNHYRKRVEEIEKSGFLKDRGYEPGGKYSVMADSWKSEYPNIDIKHGKNLSRNKWSLRDFRDIKTAKGFISSYEIPGWGKTSEIINGLVD